MGIGAGAHRNHQNAAPFGQRLEARQILIGHVMPAAAEIANLGLERGGAARDLAADLAHAVDADAAAGIARLRTHQRRRFCRRPVAAPHIMVRRQQAARDRQHQRDCEIGNRGRIGSRTVPDRDLALRRRCKVDPVIAGAVADDRSQRGHLVHHCSAQRGAACGDHRPDAGELFRREHFMRRLARGVHQLETLPDARHHRLGEA